jgi:hypothetical protein
MEKLFQSIGLSETKARETAKNISVSNPLQYYILQAQELLNGSVDKKRGNLLYHLATRSVSTSISSLCRSCMDQGGGTVLS